MTNNASQPHRPQDFAYLIDQFTQTTPGVTHTLLLSSDGLPLTACGMTPEIEDKLAASISGLLALGANVATCVGQPGCEHIHLRFPAGHFVFMRVGNLAGLGVLANEKAQIGLVASQMARLVESVGRWLTPQARQDLSDAATAGRRP
ncbi:roadblock/LC7 domain-containing protein [Actinoallomurus sp. NPDC052274]|uniref:roadblock/LC7 domain-containing protein n=1 Tax=Actinoallomurus sp. NPDC052274 TaxID=3155420 RepID=UPI00341AA778